MPFACIAATFQDNRGLNQGNILVRVIPARRSGGA
jgi:hypothetical protein